jgi:hypothetical protein
MTGEHTLTLAKIDMHALKACLKVTVLRGGAGFKFLRVGPIFITTYVVQFCNLLAF